jgi:hypothetical protein
VKKEKKDDREMEFQMEKDPEHGSYNLRCFTSTNGSRLETSLDLELVSSGQFEELRKLSKQLSSLGMPPFVLKIGLIVDSQLHVGKRFHHARVAQPALHLVEHLLVFVQRHQEGAQVSAVQHRFRAIPVGADFQRQVLRGAARDLARELLLVLANYAHDQWL